jgi:hypothetical protein
MGYYYTPEIFDSKNNLWRWMDSLSSSTKEVAETKLEAWKKNLPFDSYWFDKRDQTRITERLSPWLSDEPLPTDLVVVPTVSPLQLKVVQGLYHTLLNKIKQNSITERLLVLKHTKIATKAMKSDYDSMFDFNVTFIWFAIPGFDEICGLRIAIDSEPRQRGQSGFRYRIPAPEPELERVVDEQEFLDFCTKHIF